MFDRQSAYLGDHRALTRTIYGHKMFVDTRDISLAPHLLLDGDWEAWITKVFLELVRPGMTVVDVGANFGWYSLLAAQRVGEEGRVFSFEANPRTHKLLSSSIEINGFLDRARTEQLAVMDQPGEISFYAYRDHHGSSSVVTDAGIVAQFRDAVEEITVPATSLDDYFAAAGGEVDLMKIDAEGAEPQVIAGARRLLEESPRLQILMEYDERNRPAVELLTELGYMMATIGTDSSLTINPVELLETETHHDMLYFARPTTLAELVLEHADVPVPA